MAFKLSAKSKERLAGVNPLLLDVINSALKKSKIDFGIPALGGLRTSSEQHQLFLNGKTQLDGYKKKSSHQSGNAFDVFAYVDGRASWDERHLTHIATAILAAASEKGIAIMWGGHWRNFVDMPHFELLPIELSEG